MSNIQPRSHALDNFRTSLTALVILHHAAIPYGGAGSWLYTSAYYASASSIPLLAFNVVNQSFFMASFFLLSAYFSSVAAQKRTRKIFLREKWRRIGVPTIIYSVVSKGIVRGIVAWRMHDASWTVIRKEVWEGVKNARGVGGPVWYCALLFILDILYTVFLPFHFAPSASKSEPKLDSTSITPGRNQEKTSSHQPLVHEAAPSGKTQPLPTVYVLIAFIFTAITSFLVRTKYPVGSHFKPLFLQLAFTPQYLLYYTAGIYMYRSGRTLNGAITTRTLRYIVPLAIGITSYGLFKVTSHIASGTPFTEIVKRATGGFNIFALVYAFWNEFLGLFFCFFLLKLFSSYPILGKKWKPFGFDIGKYSYAAFLVHTPLLVDIQCAFGKSGLEKRGAVGTGGGCGRAECGGELGGWVDVERGCGLGVWEGIYMI